MLTTEYPKSRAEALSTAGLVRPGVKRLRTSLLQDIALERRLLKKALTRHKDAVRASEKRLAQLALDVRNWLRLDKPLPASYREALEDASASEVELRQRAAKWRRRLRELDKRELKEVERLRRGGLVR